MEQPPTHADSRVLAERYVLLEPMGSGGAGVVWRAHDRVLDRVVAVKLLHADVARDDATASRFRAEATAAAKLTHPHAVVVYDIGRDGEHDYLVMELVEGATLADVLTLGALPPGAVALLGEQIGRALGAAHGRGLVHRDVKPANVLITDEGIAKVADFGIARALGESTSRLTRPGHVMGTARYLAPEQLRDHDIDARADVYALGLLLHQALTGQLPFGEGTAVELASRRLVASPPPASEQRADLPPALDAAVVRATQLDPEHRFGDGAEFAAALGRSVTSDAPRLLADLVRRTRSAPLPLAEHDPGATAAMGPVPTGVSTPRPDAGTGRVAETTPVADTGPLARREEAEATAALGTASSVRASAPTPAGDGATAHRDDRVERRGPPRVLLAVVLLLAVAVGVAGVLSAMGPDDEPATDPPPSDDPAPVDEDPEPEVLEILDAADHDPFGSGEEHPADVPNAFDGDPTTTWQTQRYRGSPQLGGLKPGVGIWLDLGEPRTVDEIVLSTTNPGADLTVYVGDAPPEAGTAPENWGDPVAAVEGAAEEERIELEDEVEAQVWLLWFTTLPPDGGEFRATVSEVEFVGS